MGGGGGEDGRGRRLHYCSLHYPHFTKLGLRGPGISKKIDYIRPFVLQLKPWGRNPCRIFTLAGSFMDIQESQIPRMAQDEWC